MKKSFFIFFLSCFVLCFNSCDEFLEESPETGTVRYEITSESDYFHISYDNQYGNSISEVVNGNNWFKEIEGTVGEYVSLKFDEGPETYGGMDSNGVEELTTLSISFDGNVLISYTGVTEFEIISCQLEN